MNLFTGNSVESIHATLNRFRNSHGLGGLYVLVDRVNGLPSSFEEALDDLPASARTPLVDPSLRLYPDKALELVRLTADDDAFLLATVDYTVESCQAPDYGYGHSFVAGWLFTDDAPRFLVRACLTLFDQTNSRGEGVYFRGFDPRVRRALKRIVAPVLPGELLGGALAWAFLDNEGSLVMDMNSSAGKLALDRSAWKTLDRLTWLHPSLAQWARKHNTHPHAEMVLYADELVRRALDIHRLRDAEDIHAFVVHGLDDAPDFDQRAEVLAMVKETVRHHRSLAEQLLTLTQGSSAPRAAFTE